MPSGGVHEKVPPRTNPRRDFCLETMKALPLLNHLMRLGRALLNRDGLAIHHLPCREEDPRISRHLARNGIGNVHDALFIIVTLQHDRMVSASQAVAVAVVPRSCIAPAGVSAPFGVPYFNRLAARHIPHELK